MTSFTDIAFGSDRYIVPEKNIPVLDTVSEPKGTRTVSQVTSSTPNGNKRTLHPLSNLPFDVARDVLAEKYCKMLVLFKQHERDIRQLRKRCNFLENNNQILTNEINETKNQATKEIEALKLQKVRNNETNRKFRQIRRQQRVVRDAAYLSSFLHNKKDINNLKDVMLTPIPGIGYRLKQRLIAYLSQNHLNHIDELKGIVEGFGKKRLEILKAVFFCGVDELAGDSDNGCNLPFDDCDYNLPNDEQPDKYILGNLVNSLNNFCK
jgi:DNA uptake protein ComE-like DNA-binding protein